MKNIFLIVLVFVAFFASQTASGAEEAPLRVLIVDDHGPGYYHMPTATPLRDIVRQHKDFEVVLVEDAEVLGSDLLFDYDVVLLHFKNYKTPKRDAAMKANLVKFVEDGGGLFVFHFACGAFEDWPEFEKLAGRIWDPKKPGHDPYGSFTVRIIDKEHPITKNSGDFSTSDELYTCLKDSEVPIHVIAEATSKVDGNPHPMAFVLERGKGRIFHTTLGHDEKSLSAEGVREMIARALRWCAGRDSVPKPTQTEVDAATARIKEITESLPENSQLLAYLDCGGPGRSNREFD